MGVRQSVSKLMGEMEGEHNEVFYRPFFSTIEELFFADFHLRRRRSGCSAPFVCPTDLQQDYVKKNGVLACSALI